jgi:L-seryl-tRNA(Ser) seleniumtransferase
VQDSVAAGVDLVCFSGDKLLGGPQAGIVVGQAAAVAALRKHPLMRAIRPDKLTLASLGATLVHYVRGEAEREVPVWRMLSAPSDALERRARLLADGLGAQAVQTRSTIGGGSLPGQTQPSWALGFPSRAPDALAATLRQASPPVIGRIERDQVLLDLRTVLPEHDDQLLGAVHDALRR